MSGQEREDMGEPADSRQAKSRSRRPTDAEFDPKVVLGLKLVSIQSRAGRLSLSRVWNC